MRALLGAGAIGEFVLRAQTTLAQEGFYSRACDGWFGPETATAVSQYQHAHSMQCTGTIDDTCWASLIREPIPSVSDRSLHLTASFENHGFRVAVGNFDGAFLTWGIIGFTLASGEIAALIENINLNASQTIQGSFGSYAAELFDLMSGAKDQQKSWANEHTLPNGQLAEPWRSMFSKFGSQPDVQAEQLNLVRSDYTIPAIALCRSLELKSELGLALCFDIQVQNGGLKPATRTEIEEQRSANTGETELLNILAGAVADSARIKWREDVRTRKMTIAMGRGIVHGHLYVLEEWGLSSNYAADEVARGGA